MAFYKKTRKTASRLLKKFGAAVTIHRTIKGEYEPSTGDHGPDTVLEWSPFAVRTQLQKEYLTLGGDDGTRDGTRIEVGDMQILVDCQGHPHIPQVGDEVEFADGETWRVVQDIPVSPAGTVVLYKGVIRKG